MKPLFQEAIDGYVQATKEDFKEHWMAKKFRKEYPAVLKGLILNDERFKIEGSPGKGNWTYYPWIAIFDRLITTSAQKGYYPVFLFKRDMSGYYLSLNQGVTEIRNDYKREAKSVLELRAEDFRARLGKPPGGFTEDVIDLEGDSSSTVKLYEAGNIISKYYHSGSLPSENQLREDLITILDVYEHLIYNDSSVSGEEEGAVNGVENFKNLRLHYRVERNRSLIKKVKKAKGYVCETCKFDFKSKYGALGDDFIEAHHLTPVSQLKGKVLKLDAVKDFAVLCSNCHRMIHRLNDPSDLAELRKIISENS